MKYMEYKKLHLTENLCKYIPEIWEVWCKMHLKPSGTKKNVLSILKKKQAVKSAYRILKNNARSTHALLMSLIFSQSTETR